MNQWGGGGVMVYRTVATRNSESVGGGGVMVYKTVATRNSESVGGGGGGR